MLERLRQEVRELAKPAWRPMLAYVAALHERSTHPPQAPFPYPWEEIGPGYCYGPAFGHWDLIHQVFDSLPVAPEHALNQLRNNLANQMPDGLVPGSIWMPKPDDIKRAQPRWSTDHGHPPVWCIAAQDYIALTGDVSVLPEFYAALQRQITWFEEQRSAKPQGFYYTDILTQQWESGIDEGVRFHDVQPGPFACVDATSHMAGVYRMAARWAMQLDMPDAEIYQRKFEWLKAYIQKELWDEQVGFFFDSWSVNDHSKQHLALEGMWPLVMGLATRDQANRVIDEYLLNPDAFFTAHPLATVAPSDPLFELCMWRGPTWNSMTYWAARACRDYGRNDAARALLERALDASAVQFERTGTVWEFYHPHGGKPEALLRKPHTTYNTPCRDYLGHNPLLAMARLWKETNNA